MFSEENDKQDNHAHPTGYGGRYGRSFCSHGRQAELTKNQGIVSDNVHHVDQHRDQHGVNGFVGTTQGRRNSQRDSLKESKRTYNLHVTDTIFQQFRTKSHPSQ